MLFRSFNERFVDFFIFDGELANSLLDHEKTNADRIIEDLFQLNIINDIKDWVTLYWKQKTEEKARAYGTTSTTFQGYNKWAGWKERLEARIKQLESEKRKKERDRDKLIKKFNELNKEVQDHIVAKSKFANDLKGAENGLINAENHVKQLAGRLLNKMRDPYSLTKVFGEELLEFKGALDRVKLPESTAKEFFEELANEVACICGRTLDDQSRENIRARTKSYLGSEDVALLNTIKSDISSHIGTNPDTAPDEFKKLLEELQKASRGEQKARTILGSIKTDAVHADPALERKVASTSELQNQIGRLDKDLEKFDDPSEIPGTNGFEQATGIKVLKQHLKTVESKLAQVGETILLKSKTDLLVKLLNNARIESKKEITKFICDNTNQFINRIMPHNAIQIEGVDRCLRLGYGKGGGSQGETLSTAYAFLSTLFNSSDHQLPFVVDSPAGPLDSPKRRAIAKLIPDCTQQFVAFTISTERLNFQDTLHQIAGNNIQYLTLFRNGDPLLEAAAKGLPNISSFSDGTVVPGKKFFETFQVDEE